ncbi:MAG: hypothetical protein R6V56_02235 [Lentisphaeria bacterium]
MEFEQEFSRMLKLYRFFSLTLALTLAVSCQSLQSQDTPKDEGDDTGGETVARENGETADEALPQSEDTPTTSTASEPVDTTAASPKAKTENGLPPGYTLDELKRTIRKLENSRAETNKFEEDIEKSKHEALNEVTENLLLPKNYGRTVRISPKHEPLALPPGPMEKLVEKKVSMQLTEAGVQDMVMALSNIDGLNIIADQALQADRKLTVSVQDVPLKDLLSYVSRNMGLEFHVGRNVIWVTQSTAPGAGGPDLETRIFKLRKGFIPNQQSGGSPGGGDSGAGDFSGAAALGGEGSEDTELYDALEALLVNSPEKAVLRVFKNRNILLVRNTPENIRLIEEAIKKFDIIPLQVLIQARFLTISQSDLNALGVSIEASNNEGVSSVIDKITGSTSFPPLSESSSPTLDLAISGIISDHSYDLILTALHKLTDAETLSAPRLTVMNNQTARIRRGTNFYYWEEWELVSDTILTNDGASAEDTGRSSVQPVGAPQEIEEGITLDVHVNVGNDSDTVLLALAPTIKKVESFNTFDATGNVTRNARQDEKEDDKNQTATTDPVGYVLPEISESSVITKVAIESGETVVLGGILETRIQEEVHKVPVLGDIPYIGALFRRTLVSRDPRHLLIFVTARIVNPSGEYIEVSQNAGQDSAE